MRYTASGEPGPWYEACQSCHDRFGHAARMMMIDVLPKGGSWRRHRKAMLS